MVVIILLFSLVQLSTWCRFLHVIAVVCMIQYFNSLRIVHGSADECRLLHNRVFKCFKQHSGLQSQCFEQKKGRRKRLLPFRLLYFPDLHPGIGRPAIGTLLIICLKVSYLKAPLAYIPACSSWVVQLTSRIPSDSPGGRILWCCSACIAS